MDGRPNPALEAGPTGAGIFGGLHWPSVIRTTQGYAMYYAGFAQIGGRSAIGMATSTDGITWTKHDGPVLVPEAAWERSSLDRPRVAVTPHGLVMVYAGGRLTDRGVAWSADGVTWTRDGSQPAITQADFPIVGQAWDAALVAGSGTIDYYLEIGGAAGAGTNIYRAVATLP